VGGNARCAGRCRCWQHPSASLLLVALGAVAAGLTWLHAASALAATVGYNSSLSCRWEGQGALSTTQ